ncbi:MAG: AAA family ATPase, partial [Rhodospirillales bacterium]|nr:AAA family ATPase [Rhodospirillales bacterium]
MNSSLFVNNYRGLVNLAMRDLSRVNLVFGANGTGKTSLLEAAWIHDNATTADMIDVMRQRNDLPPRGILRSYSAAFWNGIESLRPFGEAPKNLLAFTIASAEQELTFAFERDAKTSSVRMGISGQALDHLEEKDLKSLLAAEGTFNTHYNPSHFVPPAGLSQHEALTLWDCATLTDKENRIEALIRLVVPALDRVSVIADPVVGRIPVAKILGVGAVPVRRVGGGADRLFGLGLAAVHTGRLLLVDEIENGVHYSVHEGLWEWMFEMARVLDIQILATTHSWDCVVSFAKVAAAQEEPQGALFRLDRDAAQAITVTCCNRELEAASRSRTEAAKAPPVRGGGESSQHWFEPPEIPPPESPESRPLPSRRERKVEARHWFEPPGTPPAASPEPPARPRPESRRKPEARHWFEPPEMPVEDSAPPVAPTLALAPPARTAFPRLSPPPVKAPPAAPPPEFRAGSWYE